MKTALKLVILFFIAAIYSCGGDNFINPCPSGKLPLGDTVYRYNEDYYSNPTKFIVYAKSKVNLAKGSYGAFEVKGPQNLIGRIQTHQKGDTLYLDYDKCIFKFGPFETTIFGTEINEVSIYDSSICAFDAAFSQENIKINTNDRTSGTISGEFGTLEINNTSENQIFIEGIHQLLVLSHSGRAELDILSATIKNASINHNSTEDIYIAAVETLTVNLNNAGNIYYEGDPVLVVTQNGTGQAIKR